MSTILEVIIYITSLLRLNNNNKLTKHGHLIQLMWNDTIKHIKLYIKLIELTSLLIILKYLYYYIKKNNRIFGL